MAGIELSASDKLGMTPEELEALTGAGAEEAARTIGASEEQQAEGADDATQTVAEEEATAQAREDNADKQKAAAQEHQPADEQQPAADAEALQDVVSEERPFVPRFDGGDQSKIDERIAELTTKKNEAFAKLMEGEISPEDYSKADAELQAERERLTIARTLVEANAQATEQYEIRELQKLVAAAKRSGEVDYTDRKAAARFDAEVAMLNSDPDWADRDVTERYAEAHKNVVMVMGKKPAASAAPAPAPAAQAKPVAAPPVLGPRTLAGLPNAAPAGTGGDPVLDKFSTLQGDDAERYLASLPKAEVERLMRSTVH